MATLAPYVFFQEFDNNGDPLSGGKVYTYEAGTTTPKATYTDSTGNTANANPVVLDSSGRADIWLGDGGYKFVLKTSADVTIKTVDNVGGTGSTAFGADVQTLATNTTINTTYANSALICTSAITLSLLDVSTAGEGFYISVKNASSGNVTIDPDTTELVDGASTLLIPPGYSALISCTGTAWRSFFLTPQTLQSEGSAGIGFKNSGGTTVMTVGPTNTTNVSIAGGLTLGTDLALTEGGTGASTGAGAYNNISAPFNSDRVLYGLTLSNNVSDATNDIDIAAGACVSDDGTTVMSLSAITKQLDAAWAVGTNQGGLDTGTIANTTYHLWVINRPDTNVTDVLFSASASAPTMPANYTKKKCIGSIIRTGAAIKAFTQYGNYFEWASPVVDVDAQNPGTSATTRTLNSIPTGVKVRAHIFAGIHGGSTNSIVGYISSLSQTDLAPQATSTTSLTGMGNFHGPDAGSRWSFTSVRIWTNTSAQVRTRIDASSLNDRIGLISAGWMDPRI